MRCSPWDHKESDTAERLNSNRCHNLKPAFPKGSILVGRDVNTNSLLYPSRVEAVTFYLTRKRLWLINTSSQKSHGSSQVGYFVTEIFKKPQFPLVPCSLWAAAASSLRPCSRWIAASLPELLETQEWPTKSSSRSWKAGSAEPETWRVTPRSRILFCLLPPWLIS